MMFFIENVRKHLGQSAELLVRKDPITFTREDVDALVLLLREGERALMDLQQQIRVLEHDLSVEKKFNSELKHRD